MSSTSRVLPFEIEEVSRTPQQKPQISPSTKCILHEVRHGYFKWSIENFSCFPSADDQYIQSPIFELDASWWYLAFHPKVKMCGRDNITISLMRHKSDPAPQIVAVSYRLGLESGDNKVWFKPEERVLFSKGDVCAYTTSTLGHLEDFLEEGFQNNDIVSVLCELYVFYEQRKSTFQEVLYDLDVDLPINLQRLFQSESRSDVLIITPKARARAHKCVLSARSKTLAKMLDDGKSVIQLNCTPSCLYCVLNYIYGGNLIFLTKNVVFSIGLYELVRELSLSEFSDYLTPWKIEQKSQILVEECSFAFAFHSLNVDDIQEGNIKSRFLVDKGTGIGIRLCLQQISNPDYVEFCVEASGTTRSLYFHFQLYILNESSDGIDIIPAQSIKNPNYENLIAKYIVGFPLRDILSFSAEGNLYLNLSCKRYSLIHLSYHSSNNIEEPPVSSYLTWHQDLSWDMKNLFEGAYLSDVSMITPECSIKAHRSIIGIRSEKLRGVFHNDHHKKITITLSDVEPNTLYLMLLYIYSGSIKIKMEQISIKSILDLYKASLEYNITSLGKELSGHLASNLDKSFVFDVVDIADHYGDINLVIECKKYIVDHDLKKEDGSEDTDDSTSGEGFWDEDDSDEEEEESSNEDSPDENSSDDDMPEGGCPEEGTSGEESSNEDSPDENSSDEDAPDDNGPDNSAPGEESSNEEMPEENYPDEGTPGEKSSAEDLPEGNYPHEGTAGDESSNDSLEEKSSNEGIPSSSRVNEGYLGEGSSKEESRDKKSEKKNLPCENLLKVSSEHFPEKYSSEAGPSYRKSNKKSIVKSRKRRSRRSRKRRSRKRR